MVLVEEFGAVVDVPDVEGYTPFHRAANNACLEACKVLIALGADVRLETTNKEWAYEMSLINDHPEVNNLIEKALSESGPYPLEAEDDDASLEEKLEAQSRAREAGGEEAVLALVEYERSAEGRLKAFCRKRERRRRAYRNYKHSLLQPGQMPVPGAAAAWREEVARRERAVEQRMVARIQANFAHLRRATRFDIPPASRANSTVGRGHRGKGRGKGPQRGPAGRGATCARGNGATSSRGRGGRGGRGRAGKHDSGRRVSSTGSQGGEEKCALGAGETGNGGMEVESAQPGPHNVVQAEDSDSDDGWETGVAGHAVAT